MSKLKVLLLASLMCSLGASDAMAQRRPRVRSRTSVQQRQQRSRIQRTRTRTRVRTRTRFRTEEHASRSRSGLSNRAKAELEVYKNYMIHDAISQNATPPFLLVSNKDAVSLKQTRSGDYHKAITAAFDVQGVPASGEISLTGLLPVSAHTGQAQQFAKSNVYNLIVTHADGTKQNFGKIPSTGLVTEKAIDLHLKPGKTIIQFWPDGSGGVGGFKAGREIELNWSGK